MSQQLYTTDRLFDIGRIPPQFRGHILDKCPRCELPIIRNYELTLSKCANFYCVSHMKHRAEKLLKHLGVDGIGPATARDMLLEMQAATHFEIVGKVFGENKPRVALWEIAMFSYIPGYRLKWQDMLSGYKSFTEYFNSNTVPYDVRPFKSYLIEAEKYFEIKRPLSRNIIEVMLNGSVPGYSNRDMFINACNAICGHIVQVKQVGVKKSSDYCVTMDKLSGERKVKTAREEGLPIMYPDEFLQELRLLVRDALAGK